jgi:prepilin-type N-terminal cleavage/methylation domain-containing protein
MRAARRFTSRLTRGYTLIELLIVLAIVMILAGVVSGFLPKHKSAVGNCDASPARGVPWAILAVPVLTAFAIRWRGCTLWRPAASKILICGKTVCVEDSRSLSC